MESQYEELAQRVKKGMEWIDSPERTKEERDKWFPSFKIMFDELTKLEREMRNERNQQ
jgi:hypothetical protein